MYKKTSIKKSRFFDDQKTFFLGLPVTWPILEFRCPQKVLLIFWACNDDRDCNGLGKASGYYTAEGTYENCVIIYQLDTTLLWHTN